MFSSSAQSSICEIQKVEITTQHKVLEVQRKYLWKFRVHDQQQHDQGGCNQCSVFLQHSLPSNKFTIVLNGTQTILNNVHDLYFGCKPYIVQTEPIILGISREKNVNQVTIYNRQAFDLHLNVGGKYSTVLSEFNKSQEQNEKQQEGSVVASIIPYVLLEPTGTLEKSKIKTNSKVQNSAQDDWYSLKQPSNSKNQAANSKAQPAVAIATAAPSEPEQEEFQFFSFDDIQKQHEMQQNLLSAVNKPAEVIQNQDPEKIQAPEAVQNDLLADFKPTIFSEYSMYDTDLQSATSLDPFATSNNQPQTIYQEIDALKKMNTQNYSEDKSQDLLNFIGQISMNNELANSQNNMETGQIAATNNMSNGGAIAGVLSNQKEGQFIPNLGNNPAVGQAQFGNNQFGNQQQIQMQIQMQNGGYAQGNSYMQLMQQQQQQQYMQYMHQQQRMQQMEAMKPQFKNAIPNQPTQQQQPQQQLPDFNFTNEQIFAMPGQPQVPINQPVQPAPVEVKKQTTHDFGFANF